MLNIVLAALAIAATLTGYTVHTILSYKPRHALKGVLDPVFVTSFAQPSHVKVVAQKMSHYTPIADLLPNDGRLMAYAWEHLGNFGPVGAIHDPVPCLETGTCTHRMTSIDWAQVAEDSLTHSQHGIRIPTGAEFDAAQALIAADVTTSDQAKRPNVRVHALAADCDVDSKFLRTVLEHQFGIATKSPSSTVTAQQADEVREFFYTHTDV